MRASVAKLGDCKRDASDGTVEALQKIVPAIRQRFGKKVRIIVRAESGFAGEAIMAWCEENHVFYCLGLARNDRLAELLKTYFEALRAQIKEGKVETPCRSFTEFPIFFLDPDMIGRHSGNSRSNQPFEPARPSKLRSTSV